MKLPKIEEEEKKVTVETSKKELQKEPFNKENLNKFWLLYVDEVKKTSSRMYSSLKEEKLNLLEDNKVELEFGNSSLLEEFDHAYKLRAQHYLRTNLKNDFIELCLKISEQAKTNTNILYTPQDKYKYLSEKNPLLDKLKQDFNLDYE